MKKYILPVIIILTLFSCKPEQEFYKILGNTQGTTYSIIYEGNDTTLRKSEVDSLLHSFDMSLSTYVPNSLISRINKGDTTVVLDKYFRQMLEKSFEVYKESNGMFDITVAPVVNAWGFGYTSDTLDVDSALIDSLLKYVGMDKIKIKNNKLIKKYLEIKLDGNAIAQGQSVDIVADYIEKKGINNYLVEIGGELKSKGKKFGNLWVIGIDKPIDNIGSGENIQVKLKLDNMALATSGNYRKFYVKDGVRYSHSINPKTGYPAKRKLLSATILAPDCISADAYATACMVMGLEKAKEMVKNNSNLDAYFVYSDSKGKMKVYYTDKFKNMIIK